MVLLQKITEGAIVDNLKKRFMDNCIYVSFKLAWTIHVHLLYCCVMIVYIYTDNKNHTKFYRVNSFLNL